ncbi:hypothetical protein C8Q77DRAFT_1068342 [Trametes polyzona]|nr:hypothetical protein C8Q77DRAFT_1068342 [Trametes polyzona]
MTPPTPPPAEGDRHEVSDNVVERKLIPRLTLLRVSHRVVHHAFWISGLIEATTIIAVNFADSVPFAGWIIRTFLPNGGAGTLRLSVPFFIGWAMNLAGTFIRIHCYRRLDRAFTFELAIQKEQKLVTDGAYGIVRHPSYTGGFLAGIGCFMAQLSPGCWLHEFLGLSTVLTSPLRTALFWAALLGPGLYGLASRIRTEDEMLKKAFGKEWEGWARRVPYALIPGVL